MNEKSAIRTYYRAVCPVLFWDNNRQPRNPCEVAVAGHQSCSKCQRCSRYPQIVFIETETPLLAGQLEIGVEVRRAFRDRLATECVQELKTGFFEFGAAFACWQSGDPKQYFAPNDRACNDTITRGQTGNPAVNSGGRPHQVADGVCVQEIDHPCGNSSNVP